MDIGFSERHIDNKHQKACERMYDYLDSKSSNTGYLLTLAFRKDVNKTQKAAWAEIKGKRIFDVIV